MWRRLNTATRQAGRSRKRAWRQNFILPRPRLPHVAQRRPVPRVVPDLCLAYPAGEYHGLWIEMKRRAHGYASAEQLAMLSALRSVGYDAAVCRGWEEAREKIQNYLGLKTGKE